MTYYIFGVLALIIYLKFRDGNQSLSAKGDKRISRRQAAGNARMARAAGLKSAGRNGGIECFEGTLDQHRVSLQGSTLSITPPQSYTNLKSVVTLGKSGWPHAPSKLQALLGREGHQLLPEGDIVIDSQGIVYESVGPTSSEIRNLVSFSRALLVEDLRQTALEHLNNPLEYSRMACLALLKGQPLIESEKPQLRRLLQVRDIEVRLTAAGLLGSEALDVLLEVVVEGNESLATKALAILKNMPEARKPLLQSLNRVKTMSALARSLDVLHTPANEDEAAQILKICRKLGKPNVTEPARDAYVRALEVLGRFQWKPGQEYLLDVFDHDHHEKTRLAALRALENANAEAVARLHGFLFPGMDYQLETHIKTTIQMIQSRLGNVERGWLTLKEGGEEGGLSIAQPEDGGLSIIDPGNKDPI